MFKKLIGFAFAALMGTSASAAIIKYEMKDVIGSGGTTLNGVFYQSTEDNAILYFGLVLRGPTVNMEFDPWPRPMENAHNYFGGDGPTSFRVTSTHSGDYFQQLDLVFLPGTHQDVVVRGTASQTPRDTFYQYASFTIQYGTVKGTVVTDPGTLQWISEYPKQMTPVVSQAFPVEVPEPASLPLLMLAAAAAVVASRRRTGI